MDKIEIIGGTPLRGRVNVSGAKNAALPLMAASILVDGMVTFTNVPDLMDIKSIRLLLESLGAVVEVVGDGYPVQVVGDGYPVQVAGDGYPVQVAGEGHPVRVA
ncbi:MAG: hypothetical protein HQK66_10275, partial [Desulfamplus sp.]|nr:hypothetical protein [Desulfamplus sp.]